ncbi:MAG: hypothetical protein ACI39U_01150, partial [Candidatus Cryptobacteroides sp.]
MKRNAIFWMTVAVICVSCSKVMVQDEKSQPDESGKDVYQGAVAVTFTAVSDDTKTTIGELVEGKRSISWEKDDEIAIFFSDKTTTSKAVSAGLSTEFTANVDEADAYYAVYPASAGSLNGNEVTVSIPSTQDVSSGFRAAHYAAALAVDDNFAFKNICGWIKFTVEDPEIKRIIVRGNGEQAITGNVTVTFDESGNIASTTVSGGNSRLIIDIDGAGEYYAAVLPGMNLENGVGFRFYTDHSTDSGKAV